MHDPLDGAPNLYKILLEGYDGDKEKAGHAFEELMVTLNKAIEQIKDEYKRYVFLDGDDIL